MSDNKIFRVGFTRIGGDKVQLYTPYESVHNLTRKNARKLGEALILMADLADQLDENVCEINLGKSEQ